MRTINEIRVEINAAIAVSKTAELMRLATEVRALGTVEAEIMEAHTLGIMYTLQGDALRSIEHHQRALALSEEHADVAGIARASGNIGNGYLSIGDIANALAHFERALAIHRDIGDTVGVARGMGNIGNLYQQIGNYTAAMEQYRRALELYTERGDHANISLVTGNIGSIYARTGDQSLALEYYRRSLSMYEDLENPAGIARLTNNVGNVYHTLSDFPAALEYFHRAQAAYHKAGNRNGVADTISNIGLVYADTGEYAKAIEHYQSALATYEEVGDRFAYAIITANMASVYGIMDDPTQALVQFRRALDLHRELDDRPGISRVTGRIARALISMGEYAAATELLDEQESMQMDDPEVRAEYLSNRSDLCIANQDLDGAHRFLLQALEIASGSGLRAIVADIHKHVRDLAQKRNDFATYIEHNDHFMRLTEEIRGKETTQRMAMMEAERKVEGERREREKERALLFGTLPKSVADRMIRGERVTGDHYELATVIFVDIVGFTQISDGMDPGDVVLLLEQIFTQFDAICERHNVTKIKTIGDSYMCVSFDSVVDAALCAVEMSRISHSVSHFVSHSVSHEVPDVSHEVAFRIGVHCGPVTAGVIGTQRMQYDVWGDTVNVASRMESAGEPGKVHVSEAFALNLKECMELSDELQVTSDKSHEVSHSVSHSVSHNVSHSVSHEVSDVSHSVSHSVSHEVQLVTRHLKLVTTPRGLIDIKGKGPMRTYWLEEAV